MALFVQHGHGKSDKIPIALEDGSVQGVIFGARNESPEKMQRCLQELRDEHEGCQLLFDPQYFVCTFTPPNDRYLPKYPYYESGRSAASFTGAGRVLEAAKLVLDYQVELGVDALISPTVAFDAFSDRWHQIALNLADASLEYHAGLTDAPPLLLSFVLAEEALSAGDEVGLFLDTVTQEGWDQQGLYLIVDRSDHGYSQRFDPQRLTEYLYLVYALSEINDLRVICGYSDFVGLVLRAAGADVFTTGWSQSQRGFHRQNFVKRKAGGQHPRERYSSAPLFNSIFIGELEDIFGVGHLDDVLSGVALDRLIEHAASPESAGWTTAISQRHHWQTLHRLDDSLTGRPTNDLREIRRKLREADGLYRLLEANAVHFERATGKEHLMEWVQAIRDFQRKAGLAGS